MLGRRGEGLGSAQSRARYGGGTWSLDGQHEEMGVDEAKRGFVAVIRRGRARLDLDGWWAFL